MKAVLSFRLCLVAPSDRRNTISAEANVFPSAAHLWRFVLARAKQSTQPVKVNNADGIEAQYCPSNRLLLSRLQYLRITPAHCIAQSTPIDSFSGSAFSLLVKGYSGTPAQF